MNKFFKTMLCLVATLLMGATQAMADETPSIRFAYHGDPQAGFATGDGTNVEVSAAFLLTEDVVAQFDGAYITSVWVMSGYNWETYKNNVTDVTVWLSENIFDHSQVMKKRGRLGRNAREWKEIIFDEPYLIKKDTPVFVGATWIRPTVNDLLVITDAIKRNDGCSFWLNYYNNGEHIDWEDMTDRFGSLVMDCTISGDALPVNDVSLSAFSVPNQVPYERPTTSSFRISNRGANTVTQVSLQTKVGSRLSSPQAVNLPFALGFNESITLDFDFTMHDLGTELPVEVTCTKVNGVDDTNPSDNVVSSSTLCMKEGQGFLKRMVEEEGTGTWCGNCPRGLLGMDYIVGLHHDRWIPIGIHSGDPMEINHDKNYFEHLLKYSSYPNASFNRNSRYGNNLVNNYVGQLTDIYNDFSILPSPSNIEMKVYFADEEKTALNVETVSEFVFDAENTYRVAIAVTENGVGPYPQENYFVGFDESYGVFNKESRPSIVFDHVARYLSNYYGDENSLPSLVVPGTKYMYNTLVPLRYTITDKSGNTTSYPLIQNMDSYDVVAMLINSRTGQIENAVSVRCDGNLAVKAPTGIDGVESAVKASVRGLQGCIAIDGDYTDASVFTPAGIEVARLSGEGSIDMAPGIYLVKVDGRTSKVLVR